MSASFFNIRDHDLSNLPSQYSVHADNYKIATHVLRDGVEKREQALHVGYGKGWIHELAMFAVYSSYGHNDQSAHANRALNEAFVLTSNRSR